MKQKIQLVWIASNFNSVHQQRIRNIINDCSFVHSTKEAINSFPNLLSSNNNNIVVILSGSQISQEEEHLNSNQIVFCQDSKIDLKKFLENCDLLVLVESGFSELEQYVIQNIEFLNAQESLNLSFQIEVKEKMHYYHQIEETSFKFLLINSKLQQNYQISESKLDKEIIKLTSEQDLQYLKQSVLKKEELKKEKTGHGFSIFEKLIYYYTRDELYRKLNQNMAEQNYESMKQIMCTLFDGYSKINNQGTPPNKLYRGISFHSLLRKSYLQTLEDLKYCYTHKKSMFWNTLASTSMNINGTNQFIKGNFNILFEISLSQNNPHPYFKLQKYHSEYDTEEEVILFSQFQFQVVEHRYEKGIQYFCIEQVENNFSMALDQNQREKYWLDRINNELKPKLKIINAFYQTRINYIIKNVRNFPQEIGDVRVQLKINLDIYFYKLVQYLSQFYQNYKPHKEYLNNLFECCIQEISFKFIITEEFLVKLSDFIQRVSELLINQFIKIIQHIFNLEEFKDGLIKMWSQYYQESNFSYLSYNFDDLFLKTPTYTTKQYSWRQVHQEQVKRVQIVKFKDTNTMGYELTLRDGNKILTYISKDKIPTIIKKFDGTTSPGYTDKWQGQGKSIKTQNLNVRDVHKGIKCDLANENYNLDNLKKNKVIFTKKQIGQFGQVGGIIGTTLVDVYYGQLDYQQLVVNLVSFIFSSTFPNLQQITSILPYLIKMIKKKNISMLIDIIVQFFCGAATSLVLTYFGILIETVLGPIGLAIGTFFGGMILGAAVKLIIMKCRKKFILKVSFGQKNKSLEKNGYLINQGVNPKVQFKKVYKNVKSLIIFALSDNRIIWLAINIPKDQKIINENDKLGILSIRFPYIGPFDHESKVIFYAFGVMDENLNENNVIDDLNNNRLNIDCVAQKKIKNKKK